MNERCPSMHPAASITTPPNTVFPTMLLSTFVNVVPRTPNRVLSKHLTSNIILANVILSLLVMAANYGPIALDSMVAMDGEPSPPRQMHGQSR